MFGQPYIYERNKLGKKERRGKDHNSSPSGQARWFENDLQGYCFSTSVIVYARWTKQNNRTRPMNVERLSDSSNPLLTLVPPSGTADGGGPGENVGVWFLKAGDGNDVAWEGLFGVQGELFGVVAGPVEYPGCESVIEVVSSRGVIEISHPKDSSKDSKKMFTFDAVYDWNSRQEDLYEESIRPLVSSVLDGFNGTIFAYGQTGTGKTYTMEGPKNDPSQKGIIPKSFEQIFNYISRSSNMQYLVRASYLEIYQEDIRSIQSTEDGLKYYNYQCNTGSFLKNFIKKVCGAQKLDLVGLEEEKRIESERKKQEQEDKEKIKIKEAKEALLRENLLEKQESEAIEDVLTNLLNKDPSKHLELREKPEIGVYVKDLSSFVCKSMNEIEHVMVVGNMNRSIGATNMNEHSSRSHAIFVVTIEMGATEASVKKLIRVGKLNLVDLAGSERQSKTGASGARLKEASKINLSLSALGNVISALVDGKTTHIPYRDSKLTRILQDSLGGNSKTVMVANIGPASYNYDESLTTLRYANRAKNIKNKPRVNEDPKDALLRQYQQEIARLKVLLAEKHKIVEMRAQAQNQKKERESKKTQPTPDIPSDITEEELKRKIMNGEIIISPEMNQKLIEEIERKKQEVIRERKETEKLQAQLMFMESKLLSGGKNIVDHTNEQQRALELRKQEIAERKKREVEMRQKLEIQEANSMEFRETFTNLKQEAEVKTRKLKKLFSKLQATKLEMNDLTEEFNRDRRELELTQNDILRELKKKYMIIENFIPSDEKIKLMSRFRYDDETDAWSLLPLEIEDAIPLKRPVNCDGDRRPISDFGRVAIKVGRSHRYHGENIVNLEMEAHARTTNDYLGPTVAPKIQAVLDEALKDEGDIDVDAAPLRLSQVIQEGKKNMVIQTTQPVFPKARGLVPK
uniref:Kinesin-like protein n=1 Tax=Timema cristinae TaxID=61476 RepID=A0A7R9D3M7_TIMCR|nr:unnamed protein product [Timema cristinae]